VAQFAQDRVRRGAARLLGGVQAHRDLAGGDSPTGWVLRAQHAAACLPPPRAST